MIGSLKGTATFLIADMRMHQILLLFLLCVSRLVLAQPPPSRTMGLCSLLRDLPKFDNRIVTVKGTVEIVELDTRPTSFPIDKLVDTKCAVRREGSRNRGEIGI